MAIHVVGLGMDPGSLPEEHEERIYLAQVLVGGARQLSWFDGHPAEQVPIVAPLERVLDTIQARLAEEKEVVVLASGDPLYFGVAETLVTRFGESEVRILPNVSTLQAVAGRLKIPWQHIPTVSLHGRKGMDELLAAIMAHQWVAVLTDKRNIPSAIAQAIRERALAPDNSDKPFVLWVFEDLESEKERVGRYTLADAEQRSFSHLNMVLVERTAPPEKQLRLGIRDEDFHCESRVMTKWPVRAVGLAALGPAPDDVVWDVGAGCGAVSIEAAALMRRGVVCAMERRGARVTDIRANVARFGAYIVEPHHGVAPECFDDMPPPDKIFIGGGLSGDSTVLQEATVRLAPGGRIVIHCVLLDSLALAKAHFKELFWKHEATLIHPSQTHELAGDLHFQSQNPVFVICAEKPS